MVCLDILLIGAVVWLLASGAIPRFFRNRKFEEVAKTDLPSHEDLCRIVMTPAEDKPRLVEENVWFFSGPVVEVTSSDQYCVRFSATPSGFKLEDGFEQKHAFSVSVSIHTTASAAGSLARDQTVSATGRISRLTHRTDHDGQVNRHWVDVEMPASDWRVGE